jgi:hypothetical protein
MEATRAASTDVPQRRRVLVVIAALMLTMLLAALDQTIVSSPSAASRGIRAPWRRACSC